MGDERENIVYITVLSGDGGVRVVFEQYKVRVHDR